MNTEHAATEALESTEAMVPAARSKFVRFVMPAVMLGVLLIIVGIGTFLHFRNTRALREEVLVVKKALKEKSAALEDMTAQVANLSKQMNVLKEYSIARSHTAEEKKKEMEKRKVEEKTAEQEAHVPVPAPKAAAHEAKTHAVAEKPGKAEITETAKVRTMKAKPVAQKPAPKNCDLVGKSPEDQAAILKHCVSLLEPQ